MYGNSIWRAEFYETKMVELKVEFLDLVRASLSLGMVGTFSLSDCDDLVEPGSTIALILLERQHYQALSSILEIRSSPPQ